LKRIAHTTKADPSGQTAACGMTILCLAGAEKRIAPTTKAGPSGQTAASGMTIFLFRSTREIVT
jgi:hypothetical protein